MFVPVCWRGAAALLSFLPSRRKTLGLSSSLDVSSLRHRRRQPLFSLLLCSSVLRSLSPSFLCGGCVGVHPGGFDASFMFTDFAEMFANMAGFGGGGGGGASFSASAFSSAGAEAGTGAVRGDDIQTEVSIDLLEAIKGCEKVRTLLCHHHHHPHRSVYRSICLSVDFSVSYLCVYLSVSPCLAIYLSVSICI